MSCVIWTSKTFFWAKSFFFFQAWWLDLPTDLWSGIPMPTPPCIYESFAIAACCFPRGSPNFRISFTVVSWTRTNDPWRKQQAPTSYYSKHWEPPHVKSVGWWRYSETEMRPCMGFYAITLLVSKWAYGVKSNSCFYKEPECSLWEKQTLMECHSPSHKIYMVLFYLIYLQRSS